MLVRTAPRKRTRIKRHYLAGTFRHRHFHRILIMTIAHNRIQSENNIIYILFHHDLHFTSISGRCTSINFTQTYTVGNKSLTIGFYISYLFVTSNRIIRHFRIYQQSIGIIPVNGRTIFLSFGYDMRRCRKIYSPDKRRCRCCGNHEYTIADLTLHTFGAGIVPYPQHTGIQCARTSSI